jgi:hypothetical protein
MESRRPRFWRLGETAADRFWARVRKEEPPGSHWYHENKPSSNCYVRVMFNGVIQPAHRVAWELVNGPIEEGLEIDHLCKVKTCINPEHLEPVSHAENMSRISKLTTLKPCKRGHPASRRKARNDTSYGSYCLDCLSENVRAWQQRQKLNQSVV